MLKEFRRDPAYLHKYYARVLSLLVAACLALAWSRPPSLAEWAWYAPAMLVVVVPRLPAILAAIAYAMLVSVAVFPAQLSLAHLLLMPLAMLTTLWATSYIHNAAHGNIRPRFLRRPVGELCGLVQLVGFPDWTVVHFIHHKFADDPEWDPHPPAGLGYWQFARGVKDSIFRVFGRYYLEQHGDSEASRRRWKSLALLALPTQLAKVSFWFLLLGPQAFTFFFLVSIALKNLHYALFNWATHVKSTEGSGEMRIVNLETPLFRALNALSHGLYFHKNHHDYPYLFDPRHVPSQLAAREPLLSKASEPRAA